MRSTVSDTSCKSHLGRVVLLNAVTLVLPFTLGDPMR